MLPLPVPPALRFSNSYDILAGLSAFYSALREGRRLWLLLGKVDELGKRCGRMARTVSFDLLFICQVTRMDMSVAAER